MIATLLALQATVTEAREVMPENVDDPAFEAPSTGVGQVGPTGRDLVVDQGVHRGLHLLRNCEQPLDALIDCVHRPGDLGQQNGHVLDLLDEHVLIGSLLVGVHLVLDLID